MTEGPLTWDENGRLVPLDAEQTLRQDIDRIAVRGGVGNEEAEPIRRPSKSQIRRQRWLTLGDFIDAIFLPRERLFIIPLNPIAWVFGLGLIYIMLRTLWPLLLGFVALVAGTRLMIWYRFERRGAAGV